MSALNKYKNNIAQKRNYFGGLPKWMKRKSPVNQRLTGLCCGERGSQTYGFLEYHKIPKCLYIIHLQKSSKIRISQNIFPYCYFWV